VIAANATTFPFLSGIATRYDKVKWHKLNIRFVSALPTTSGGTVSMYFDNDRKDVGATTIGEAMQNNHCTTHPVWKEFRFNLTKQMLRSHEMFTTASGADATPIGHVSDLIHAGNDLLEVELTASGRSLLIPFVQAIVPQVELNEGWIGITPPPGLLELGDAPAVAADSAPEQPDT